MRPQVGYRCLSVTALAYSKLFNPENICEHFGAFTIDSPGSIGILPSRLYIVLISSGLNKITILPLPRPGVDNLQHKCYYLRR